MPPVRKSNPRQKVQCPKCDHWMTSRLETQVPHHKARKKDTEWCPGSHRAPKATRGFA